MRISLIPIPGTLEILISGLLILMLLAISALGTRTRSEFTWSSPNNIRIKEAGLWLGDYMPGPKRVMDVEAIVPYYADGTLLSLPFADSSVSLRYVEMKEADFIILKGHERRWRPYIEEWIRNGIPDKRAELIYEVGKTLDEKVLNLPVESKPLRRG